MIPQRLASVLFAVSALAAASPAFAQAGGSWSGGWNPQQGATGTGYGAAPAPGFQQQPSSTTSTGSTDLEISTLYVAAAAYGAGTGIWLDAELGVSDPGLRFIAPGVLGVAAPIGVYFLDHPAMPRGVPSSIAAGLTIGAGEGLGIWSYQFTSATQDKAWGFTELARSTFIGATVGGAAGAVVGFTQEPSPKTNLLLSSGALWGAGIGSMFGYGASGSGLGYEGSNDYAALGGLIGYNAGLAATAGLSAIWVPTYKQLAFMWMGAGVGFAATLPVYLFYAGSDGDAHPAKRGLIVQGVGTTLGIAAGAAFTWYDKDDIHLAGQDPYKNYKRPYAELRGMSMMPVPGGAGAQLNGVIF